MANDNTAIILSLAAEDKVWVQVEYKVQPRQHESVGVSFGQSKTVLPGQEPEKVRYELAESLLSDAIDLGEQVRANPRAFINQQEPQRTRTR